MSRDGLVGSARQMRKAPTEAEKLLWESLRRKSVDGMRFRRQRVIGPYIVDFCCLEHRLVVEVDGDHHMTQDVASYDAERSRYLEASGFRVMRFSNSAVMQNTHGVISEIAAKAAEAS